MYSDYSIDFYLRFWMWPNGVLSKGLKYLGVSY